MQNKGVIFSDVDGTLCFHQDAHRIRAVERYDDGTVLVEDPVTGKQHLTYDVTISSYNNIYLALTTRQLGHQLRDHYNFVYVTGGRPSTIHSRKERFDFADAVILESGAMILDSRLEIDPVWAKRMEPEKVSLNGVSDTLKTTGWTLDVAGRTSAIRVRRKDNLHKSDEEFESLCKELSLPSTLKKTMNLDSLDIILRSAGKGNAVKFWMETHGYNVSQTIGIGDDINDIDFLAVTGRKYVLANAYPEVLRSARENGWNISSQVHFDGINEILESILAL